MQAIYHQHNWTGALALYTTSPAQPLIMQPVKGISQQSSKSSIKGTWLKAANHARLRLHEGEDSSCGLELRLQDHLLLNCPLLEEQLGLHILPSNSTSNGSILVLQPKQQTCTAAHVCYCFRFYDSLDCNSFKSALRAAICNRHSKQMQQRQEQLLQLHQRQQLQQEQQQQRRQEQQMHHLQATAARSSDAAIEVNGHAGGRPVAPAALTAAASGEGIDQQPEELLPSGIGLHDPAGVAAGAAGRGVGDAMDVDSAPAAAAVAAPGDHIKNLIKKYLLDPSFQILVDQVDAMWDEVEQEVLVAAADAL